MQSNNTIYCNSPGWATGLLPRLRCNVLICNVLQIPHPLGVNIKYKIQCAIVQHSNVPCGSAIFLDDR